MSLTSIQWEQPRKGRFTTIIILNYNQGDKSVPPKKKRRQIRKPSKVYESNYQSD